MKKALVSIAIVGAFGLGWLSHAEFGEAPVPNSNSGGAAVVGTPLGSPVATTPAPIQHPPLLSPSEWQQLRVTREAVLRANPDLAAEYKQIMDDMQAEQAKSDAAIVKADPKAARIVAKLVALRQRNAAPAPAAVAIPK